MKSRAIRQFHRIPGIFLLACGLMLFSEMTVAVQAQEPSVPAEKDLTPYQQALFFYRSGHYATAKVAIAIDVAENGQILSIFLSSCSRRRF